MKLLSPFLLIGLALILNFCSNPSDDGNRNTVLAEQSKAIATEPAMYDEADPNNIETETIYERKLTKNGSIRFETSNLDKTKQLITNAVASLNGYISNDNTSESDNRTENSLIVRIPADKADSLITVIESNASKIDYKSIDVQDVTEQFIDLDTRVRTKKEVETRYRELLARATSVEEMLKIEEQIGNIRTEIESAEGRLRYLSNQVQYSTLNVTFYEKNSDFGFWKKMGNAFSNGWNSLLWLFVGIANLWAIILLIATVVVAIAHLTKRKRGGKQPPHPK
jgi:hypothetical protein